MTTHGADVPSKKLRMERFERIQFGKKSLDLGDLRINTMLERPVTAIEITEHTIRELEGFLEKARGWDQPTFEDLDPLASDLLQLARYVADRDFSLASYYYSTLGISPSIGAVIIEDAWTAAQVAATSVALGAAISGGVRKWKKRSLPQGSRLTLTITPAKDDDHRQPVHLVITDIDTKSESEITEEIRQVLDGYTEKREVTQSRHAQLPAPSEHQKAGKPKHVKS